MSKKLFMSVKAANPPKPSDKGAKHYKLSMLEKLIAKAIKAELDIKIAGYEGQLWYIVNSQFICPVYAGYANYCFACKLLRPLIRSAKLSQTKAMLSSIEHADLLLGLKAMGYIIQGAK